MNAGDFCPGIEITSPLRGFNPERAALSLTSKVPKPDKTTFSPVFKVSWISYAQMWLSNDRKQAIKAA